MREHYFPFGYITSNILNLQYLFKTYLMESIKLANQKHMCPEINSVNVFIWFYELRFALFHKGYESALNNKCNKVGKYN